MGINKFCSLVSSSRGNAVLLSDGKTNILVDCGISKKRAIQMIDFAGVGAENIDAILVTHEHSDHISGIGAMSRGFDIPVYANERTWEAMELSLGNIADKNRKVFATGEDFEINSMRVLAFKTPHDAAESVGYKITSGTMSGTVATDMGCIDEKVIESISGSDIVLLEANHDVNMLVNGRYPEKLKQRILSSVGHLSNEASGEIAKKLLKSGTRAILLGHLSEENNVSDIAYGAVKSALEDAGAKIDRDIKLAVANRYELSGMF